MLLVLVNFYTAGNYWLQFGFRSGSKKSLAWSGSKLITGIPDYLLNILDTDQAWQSVGLDLDKNLDPKSWNPDLPPLQTVGIPERIFFEKNWFWKILEDKKKYENFPACKELNTVILLN